MDDEEIPVEIYPTRRKWKTCPVHGSEGMMRDPDDGTWHCEDCFSLSAINSLSNDFWWRP